MNSLFMQDSGKREREAGAIVRRLEFFFCFTAEEHNITVRDVNGINKCVIISGAIIGNKVQMCIFMPEVLFFQKF